MKDLSKLVTVGRRTQTAVAVANPTVYRASTVLFASLDARDQASAALAQDEQVTTYGRVATPTSYALENAVAELEGGYRAATFPSGLAAIAGALLSCLKAGDHLLMADTVYEPARALCDGMLKRLGIETTYYDPLLGAAIAELIRPNTAAVYVESPGSLTFEVQDIPSIAAAAHAAGAVVVMDNAWASPLYFKPFEHGVDLSIQPATKYLGGHSDVVLGLVTATRHAWPRLRDAARQLGQRTGPDDVFLVLRGLRTLGVRMPRHYESGLAVARWLRSRNEVARVLHPGLPEHPGHALWRRDFRGASGLFGVELKPCSREALAAMLDHYRYFGIGYSWGGFESLVIPADIERARSVRQWCGGPLVRFHIGLEDADELIADLEEGFERLREIGNDARDSADCTL